MMFPKQTVNSSVSNLVKSGHVQLSVIPNTRNAKEVILTEPGKDLAERTAGRIIATEERAMGMMSEERMETYLRLQDEYLSHLADAFRESGFPYEDVA